MASTFREIIFFFEDIGIYDVVLPFLLVFTIVFAILEKTKILGVQKINKEELTKKNINAMVAFVIAFFVVASIRLVEIISDTMANMVILLFFSLGFIMLVGSFYKDQEFSLEQNSGWKATFIVIMFIGISLIFMDALDWLEPTWDYLQHSWDSTAAASIILLALVIGAVFLVTTDMGGNKSNSNEKSKNGK